jgi:putative SOS response-associated peptidase YedK
MFDKPAFRSAVKNRAVLPVMGFYEYHHFKGKKYPFHIVHQDDSVFYLGCLYSEWTNKTTGEIMPTFTIITVEGNEVLSRIHNNPKLTGPRMPLIIPEESVDVWLKEELSKDEVNSFLQPYPSSNLNYYTVGKLQGDSYKGNVKEVFERVDYEELNPLF